MPATQQEIRPMSRLIDPMLFDGDALGIFRRLAIAAAKKAGDLPPDDTGE